MSAPRGWVQRALSAVLAIYFRMTRGVTLGVRALVIDAHGQVLLVRHSYMPGWHLPGGGVEPGETIEQALSKELREEAGVELSGTVRLHGVFLNRALAERDHVAVFEVRSFRASRARTARFEILEAAFFPPDNLPHGTSNATAMRISEVMFGAQPTADW